MNHQALNAALKLVSRFGVNKGLLAPTSALSPKIRNMSSDVGVGIVYSADYIKDKLTTKLEANHVDVEDMSGCCGMKFNALIVSPQFDGKPILQRQRLVNQVLADEMKIIHAFTMKTLTPSQWKDMQQQQQQQ